MLTLKETLDNLTIEKWEKTGYLSDIPEEEKAGLAELFDKLADFIFSHEFDDYDADVYAFPVLKHLYLYGVKDFDIPDFVCELNRFVSDYKTRFSSSNVLERMDNESCCRLSFCEKYVSELVMHGKCKLEKVKGWNDLTVKEKTEYLRDALVKWRNKEEPYACFENELGACVCAQLMYYNKFKIPFKGVPSELLHETKEIIKTIIDDMDNDILSKWEEIGLLHGIDQDRKILLADEYEELAVFLLNHAEEYKDCGTDIAMFAAVRKLFNAGIDHLDIPHLMKEYKHFLVKIKDKYVPASDSEILEWETNCLALFCSNYMWNLVRNGKYRVEQTKE